MQNGTEAQNSSNERRNRRGATPDPFAALEGVGLAEERRCWIRRSVVVQIGDKRQAEDIVVVAFDQGAGTIGDAAIEPMEFSWTVYDTPPWWNPRSSSIESPRCIREPLHRKHPTLEPPASLIYVFRHRKTAGTEDAAS